MKEGEDFLLKKGTSKDSQGFGPYQNKPFRGPHNKKRGSYRKRRYGGNSSQSSNQSFSSGRGKPNFIGSRTPHVDLFVTHLNHKLPLYPNSRPKCLRHICSEHKLDGSHCLCLPSNSSPSQGDPKNQAMLLPDHRNSPRLARDALVLGLSAALNRDPTATSIVNNSSQTVPQLRVPQHLSLHTWCLGVDSSKNKASLWRWQRELLPLRGHQQGLSTSQSGPYLRNGPEKIRWISPLHL